MRRVATKCMPKLLSHELQQLRHDITQDMLEYARDDLKFLKTVITGDRVLGEWVEPRNQGSVVAVEISSLPKGQRKQADPGFLGHGIPQDCQAPYFPDMAPCDFCLFTKLKMPLKGCLI